MQFATLWSNIEFGKALFPSSSSEDHVIDLYLEVCMRDDMPFYGYALASMNVYKQDSIILLMDD